MRLPAAIRHALEERVRLEIATIERLGIDDRLWSMLEAPYATYMAKKALVEEIDRLRDLVGRAPTEVNLRVPGGPCDQHYLKGRQDLAKLLATEVATAFARARVAGRDLHAAERVVIDLITGYVRPTNSIPPPAPSPWDINPG